MAANIPTKLKAADLTRFCIRAAQLETAKPVIAYWCEYWIVNQILSKGLHNGDNETLQYTTRLMDKLEQIKADNATNDAIVDDIAGQAYVEQFAAEVFDRADRAVHTDNVTKQTADTFQAAATFFELVNIWGTPDAETQAKIRYAKWNAVRIAKALKDGQDPNKSNPKPQLQHEEALPTRDSNDLEVGQISPSSRSLQASVQEIPDEQAQSTTDISRQSPAEQYLPPPQTSASGLPPAELSGSESFHTVTQDDNVSPLESSQSNRRDGSIGGGYFPEIPTFTSQVRDSTLPTAPPDDVIDLGLPDQPSTEPHSHSPAELGSSSSPNESPAPSSSTHDHFYSHHPQNQTPPPSLPHRPYPPPISQRPPDLAAYQHMPPTSQRSSITETPAQPKVERLTTDDAAISQAQKHARWAISALNFEDTATAVKELRNALRTLGAEV